MAHISSWQGIVRNTIELSDHLGLPDGQIVTVMIRTPNANNELAPGQGLSQAFGGWAEEAEELDEFLAWNRQQRQTSLRELDP